MKSVIALGVFDGVHLGHKELFRLVCAQARAREAVAIAYTFDGHPKNVLSPRGEEPAQLMTLQEKVNAILRTGVHRVIVQNFTPQFASQEPDAFLRHLKKKYGMQALVAGYDVRIGAGGKGDAEYLRKICHEIGFDLYLVPPVRRGGEIVSSTVIRELIQKGFIRKAAKLGYDPVIQGRIFHGKALGRTLHFPTINIYLGRKVMPKPGVYAVQVEVAGRTYDGVANVGVNPTVKDTGARVEAHIFRFHQDVYGKWAKVRLIRFLRSERRFASVQELRKQIRRDAKQAWKGLRP